MATESLMFRFWRRLHRLLVPLRHTPASERTPEAWELLEQLRACDETIRKQERELRVLHTDNEGLRARLQVSEVQIEALAEVVARDRRRVEAETATYAQRIAEALGQQSHSTPS